MKQIVDKLNKIAKAIDSDVTISNRKLIIDSLDSITKAFGGTPNDSKLIVDKLEDIANYVHGGGGEIPGIKIHLTNTNSQADHVTANNIISSMLDGDWNELNFTYLDVNDMVVLNSLELPLNETVNSNIIAVDAPFPNNYIIVIAQPFNTGLASLTFNDFAITNLTELVPPEPSPDYKFYQVINPSLDVDITIDFTLISGNV